MAASLAAGWRFTVAYLSSVWQALVAGLVLAAAVQVLLPAAWLQRALGSSGGTRGGVRGALAGRLHADVLVLRRPGRDRVCAVCGRTFPPPSAFWLGNPALNPVVLVLCLAVLPWPWAVLRLVAGLAVVAAGIAAARWEERRPLVVADAPEEAAVAEPPVLVGSLPRALREGAGRPDQPAAAGVPRRRLRARRLPQRPVPDRRRGAGGRRSSPSRWSSPGCSCRCRPAGRWRWWPPGLAAGMPVPAAAALLVTLPMLSLPSLLMVRSVVPRRVLERTVAAALASGCSPPSWRPPSPDRRRRPG